MVLDAMHARREYYDIQLRSNQGSQAIKLTEISKVRRIQ